MKKSERIELYEKIITNWDEIEKLQDRDNFTRKKAMQYAEYKYRRTYARINEIDRAIEIPGNKKECKIRFFNGSQITVKGAYDDICIKLDDLENEQSMYYLWQGN